MIESNEKIEWVEVELDHGNNNNKENECCQVWYPRFGIYSREKK